MNRRYVIAAAAVVAVAGGWYMFGQGGGGGGSSSSTGGAAAAAGTGPQITAGQAGTAGSNPTTALYGNLTATTVSDPNGTLGSLSTFGRPRDVFIQINGASSGSGNSLTFGSTPTTTTTKPISLGSGAATAVPTTGSGGVSGVTTSPVSTPTTSTPGQRLAAEFDINGVPLVAYDGDSIPPDTQQFTVESMTTSQVTLGLNGALLASGASSVVIKVGQTITLNDQTSHTNTVVKLDGVHPA